MSASVSVIYPTLQWEWKFAQTATGTDITSPVVKANIYDWSQSLINVKDCIGKGADVQRDEADEPKLQEMGKSS